MSWILQIHTALETASVSIAFDGKLVAEKMNTSQKDHASFLHPSIVELLAIATISIKQIDAIAVVNGPGSYTGLRVGMASAKGLCYALNKPLITIGSLQIMAAAAIKQLDKNDESILYCPMIDARRMEVFTAVYDKHMSIFTAACAIELSEDLFVNYMLNKKMYFFGNGTQKWRTICSNKNADFITVENNSMIVSALAYQSFKTNKFASLAYSEPTYLKDFFSPLNS